MYWTREGVNLYELYMEPVTYKAETVHRGRTLSECWHTGWTPSVSM
jgi:hypothetical protein